jgi:hypothetical protein
MASVQNCSLLQKDSTDERNSARPARRRGKLGAAATGLLPAEAMRARMIRKGQRLWGLQPPTIGDRRAAARRGCRMAARRTRAAAMPVIGFLSTASPDKFVPFVDGFRQGLKRTGYVEGENVGIEYRWTEGNYDRLPALAADLVRRQVTVIAAIDGLPSILAAKAATGTIPVVFFTAADPIAFGLVASLNRPSGNVTGVVSLNAEIRPKRLELVHEVIPTATVMALLVNPANRLAEGLVRDSHAAARMLAFPPRSRRV